MKKIFTAAFLLLLILNVSAQMPGGNFSRGGGGNGGQMPTGRFYGKVVDPSNRGIEAASVTLVSNRMDTATKKMKEVIVGGMLTSKSGDFSVENVALFGRYTLRISGIGFKAYEKPIAFDMPNREAMSSGDMSAMLGALDKDLGNIKVQLDDKVLSTVTVTASRPMMTLGIDRKIFNVDRNITSAGGTAVDVMRNVPSLNVDIDGNVTLRNTAPTIFVDGRPTTLTLDQIPADAIESVEVITNPSAKFDASGGTAGILNVVMKKNRRVGYSGNIRTNLDSRAKVGIGGDINIRQNKINVFASGQYNQRKTISTGYTDRTTYGYKNDSSVHQQQWDRTTANGAFGFGRFGFDYFMDIRNTFTVTGNFVRGGFKPNTESSVLNDSSIRSIILHSSEQQRNTNAESIFRNKGAQLSYKHNFPKAGHEITADATYNYGKNENTSNILIDSLFYPGPVYKSSSKQIQIGNGTNENLTVQTDYSNPISANAKIEAGARAQMRKIYSLNTITFNNRNTTTVYNSTDNVYAAYATFTNRIKNFGYQLGLRAESSNYKGDVPTKSGQSIKIDYPISLFPSVFLSQKLNELDEVQFNYSRRINRPNFFQLFPFVDVSDPLNYTRGNPALKPEFTNSFEVSYSKTFKNRDNFLASLYFKNTNNLITRIQTEDYDSAISSKNIFINTYQNANSSYVTGLELTSRNKITKFWDMTANANFFTSKIDLQDQPDPDQLFSYFFKLNNSFKLPKNFSLQLSGDYQSKVITSPGGRGTGGGGFMGGGGGFFGGSQSSAQGFIRPNYGVDAAVRFEFLKNKTASISVNVNDIFRTRLFNQYTELLYPGTTDYAFVQNQQRRRDPQVFRLNFNYRFGKFDVSLFKRKNTKADSNVDMGGGQNF